MTAESNHNRVVRSITIAAALLVLNVSLTFVNVWPTPAVTWHGQLSVELALGVLILAVMSRRVVPSHLLLSGIAAIWVLLVFGRYAEVTAPALYGRPVNLYWDSRHVSAVAAMLARVASTWRLVATLIVAALVPLIIYLVLRWAIGRVAAAARQPAPRRALAIAATLALVWFAGQRLTARMPDTPSFSTPVTMTYARQGRLLASEITGRSARTLGPSPSFDSDLARVRGADVFLFFLESYGAVTYDRPELAAGLAAARAQFDADIHATGRDVVSAYVESPTFGGNSWLAHISFLTGIDVRDEDANVLLMAQTRQTLATAFAQRGYRSVAVMPGLQEHWPEGAFYGFGEIYGATQLDYRGPPFGWWTIPDQFAIARMDEREVAARQRPPLFVFFPTTGTHTPFRPTAPFQQDWARMLTDQPYDPPDVERMWNQEPDWLNLGPSYIQAMRATFVTLGGYLRHRADRDFVLILIGDHQPPAAVSGTGASWEVPVHVIASRPLVLDAMRAQGFRSGLTPAHPPLSRMHELMPAMLDAFGERE
ncbi:MAG: sulfatase-like hydrolase/transferase [Acidobacteriota bacterium]